jgi:hypothetical protein
VRTTRFIAAALLALASAGAFATTCSNGGTNWPTCTPPSSITAPASADSSAAAQAGAAATLSGTLTATGGAAGAGGSASFEDWSRQNMYVLPAPVQAAPLPPGLCPQGDSMSVGILWNLFSYARSSTRSEMECLDKVLAAIKPAPVVQQVLAPLSPADRALIERLDRESQERAAARAPATSDPVKKPEAAKVPAKKASAPKKAASNKPSTPTCEEAALQSCKPAKRT